MEKVLAIVVVFLGVLVALVAFSALFALPVEWLWNGTLVEVFPSVKQVTFMQAWGLNLLAGMLFKSSSYNSK